MFEVNKTFFSFLDIFERGTSDQFPYFMMSNMDLHCLPRPLSWALTLYMLVAENLLDNLEVS